jgi:hypothetical protein
MKTTITIEDGAASGAEASRVTPPSTEQHGKTAPIDAGAAASSGASASAEVSAGGIDGGVPPAWLIDALAAEGAMPAPSSPEGIGLVDLDAGAAAR